MDKLTPEQLKEIYFSFYDQSELSDKMKLNHNHKFASSEPPESLKEALICGFIWSDTEEGFDFWDALYKLLT